MVDFDAASNIAFVQHHQAGRDGAPMRFPSFAVTIAGLSAALSKNGVTGWIYSPEPEQTT
jgi:hypothetical protein